MLRIPHVSVLLLLCLCSMLPATALPAAQDPNPVVASACNPRTKVQQGSTRIFIALRNGKDGLGRSPQDALDGSTVDKFDRILRCYAEGCKDPNAPAKSASKVESLVVCLGPGTFQTKGEYDALIDVPHKSDNGFTVGKGWKIHGSGKDTTTIQLAAYLPAREGGNPRQFPTSSAAGTVFSTNSDDASDIEISDLTIDDNYPALKKQAGKDGITALTLEAIHLRSERGHNWIHDVNVVNASAEIGAINPKWEAFPVWIYAVNTARSPLDNSNNIIERVVMSGFGGGVCTAMAIANAVGEIRNNRVEGYQIGYGGWGMGPVHFHDNVAVDTEYGFNIDSLVNNGVVIERTQIIHPRKYGIVLGGSGTYNNFQIRNNTIQINRPGVIGLVFQGNVNNAIVSENSIVADPSIQATAIRSFSNGRTAGPNRNNSYHGNTISEKLKIVFGRPTRREDNCASANHDESGRPLHDLPDNQAGSCASVPSASPAPHQH